MIFDTQFLGALTRRNPNAQALARQISSEGHPQRIPSAVVWEISYGLGKSDDDLSELREKYEQLFEASASLTLDNDTARRAGTLRGKHKDSDRLKDLDSADSVVAAHGLILDEPVVSNDADFHDVVGLEVVSF